MKTISILLIVDWYGVAELIFPIAICVVLPIIIVWIVSKTQRLKSEQKTALMMKALEKGQQLDPNIFAEQKKNKKTSKEKIYDLLETACVLIGLGVGAILTYLVIYTDKVLFLGVISVCVGIALLVYFFIARKHLGKDDE